MLAGEYELEYEDGFDLLSSAPDSSLGYLLLSVFPLAPVSLPEAFWLSLAAVFEFCNGVISRRLVPAASWSSFPSPRWQPSLTASPLLQVSLRTVPWFERVFVGVVYRFSLVCLDWFSELSFVPVFGS